MAVVPHHISDSWEGYNTVRCTEIGDGVCIRQTGRYGKPDGYVSGFIIAHTVAGDQWRCEGGLTVDPELAKEGHLWQMSGSLVDGTLTLNPSIQCSTHPDFHAYVRNGQWTS